MNQVRQMYGIKIHGFSWKVQSEHSVVQNLHSCGPRTSDKLLQSWRQFTENEQLNLLHQFVD